MFEKLSTSDILFISSLYYTSTHIVESLITIENNLFSARKTRISFIQDQMLNEYRCELCMYILYRLLNVDNPSVKWSDWLCEVIELSMQSCGKLLSNSFETYNFLKICKSWVWAQIRRSKLLLWEWIRLLN